MRITFPKITSSQIHNYLQKVDSSHKIREYVFFVTCRQTNNNMKFVIVLSSLTLVLADTLFETTFTPKVCNYKTKLGDTITIRYVQTFAVTPDTMHLQQLNGTVVAEIGTVDSGIDPIRFTLGAGSISVMGLEMGLFDMCVGEKRTITVPSKFGHDFIKTDAESTNELTGAVFKYEVECLWIHHADSASNKPSTNLFMQIDSNKDDRLTKDEVSEFLNINTNDPITNAPIKLREGFIHELWADEDKNGDGHIDWQEFSGPKGLRKL